MVGRWISVAIVLVMMGVIGVFGWAVIRPPPPPSAETNITGGLPVAREKLITGPDGPWKLYLWVLPGADRAVTVTVSARDLEERPVASTASPSGTLRMLDMAMGPEPVVLAWERPGFWQGSTRVSMAGRWSLQVQFGGESLSVPFEAVSR